MSGGFSAAELQAEIPRLRRYARALTGSREAADDLTQDTLEHAWRKRAAYQPHGSLRAWLFTVMHHRFVNGLRTPTHAPHAPVDAAADDTAAPSADGAAVSSAAASTGACGAWVGVRSPFTKRWCITVNSHARRLPCGWYAARLRHACSSVSCVRSSAASRLPVSARA